MAEDVDEPVGVGGTEVRGVAVDDETRCAHYGSERDVVAVAFPCCGTFYSCFRCHDELVEHERERWPAGPGAADAVLCGSCGERLAVAAYFARLEEDPSCTACGAAFNPGCRSHRGCYVE